MTRRNEPAIAAYLRSHDVGDVVDGTVHSIVPFGAFVEVGPEVHGLLHHSEYDDVRPGVGDRLPVRIIAVDRVRNRMSLAPAAAPVPG